MGIILRAALCCALLLLAIPAFAQDSDAKLAGAKALFEKIVTLDQAYDPASADLYADAAVIRHTVTDSVTEKKRQVDLAGLQYKKMIRDYIGKAKDDGEANTYSDVTYAEEGNGVRITATRYDVKRKYSSPISFLVKPDYAGNWMIHEEIAESRT